MSDGQPDISRLVPSPAEMEAAGLAPPVIPTLTKNDRPPNPLKPTKASKQPQLTPEEEVSFQKLAEKESPMDFFRDLEWAYDNLGNLTAMPEDAPSGSAWYMVTYGRSARAEFMKQVMNYFIKREKDKADQEAMKDDHKKQMRFIDSLQVEMLGASREMLATLSDDDLLDLVKERGLALS